ncbi:hypothetical protein B0H19DRAFT_1277636 [Mycena capillaripes]|nr:hypothetical protein B0H19DRAFT_1277636 [Mycena capillaripes]
MHRIGDVVILSADTLLDDRLFLLGSYSRFSVHEPHDHDSFIGIFQTGRAHVLIARKLGKPGGAIRVITLEDIISRTPGKPGSAIGVITLEGASLPPSLDVIAHGYGWGSPCRSNHRGDPLRYEDNVTKQQTRRITTAGVMRG